MKALRRWRLALRLAWRDLRRSRGVSALVIALIALPVLGVSAYFTVSATSEFGGNERIARALGGADGRITVVPDEGPTLPDQLQNGRAQLIGTLGSASAPEPMVEATAVVGRQGRDVSTKVHAFDSRSSSMRPLFILEQGRAPVSDGEIGLSMAAAQRLGAGIGDLVRSSVTGRDVALVGLFTDRLDTSAAFATMALTPSAVIALGRPEFKADLSLVWLVRGDKATFLASPQPVLDRDGVLSRVESTPVLEALAIFLAALAEIAVITSAAFAVVARRQRRTHGLLAVVGAEPRQRARIAYAMGALSGMFAVLAGIPLGILAAVALIPMLQGRAQQDWGSLTVPWPTLAGVAVFAVAASTASAVLVGRSAAVARPLDALHGRDVGRGTGGKARRAVAVVLLGCGGAGIATGAFAGVPLVVLGCGLVVVGSGVGLAAVLAAATRSYRGPLWFRLALRDAAMATARPAALATAIAGIVMLTTTASFLLSGLARQTTGYVAQAAYGAAVYTADGGLSTSTIAEAARGLGASRYGTFQELVFPAGAGRFPSFVQARSVLEDCLRNPERQGGAQVSSADACVKRVGFSITAPVVASTSPADLPALLGREPTPPELSAFGQGAALVMHPGLLDGAGRVVLAPGSVGGVSALPVPGGEADPQTLTLNGLVVASEQYQLAPMVLISAETATGLGLRPRGMTSVLFGGAQPPSEQAEDEVRSMLLRSTAGSGTLEVERGDPKPRTIMAVNQIAAAAAIALSLGIVLAGVALASGESRGDFAVLAAVGADPRLRRAVGAGQAALVAGAGGAIGLVTGYLGAAASLSAEASRWTWLPVLFSLGSTLVLVAAAVIMARLLTAARLPAPRSME